MATKRVAEPDERGFIDVEADVSMRRGTRDGWIEIEFTTKKGVVKMIARRVDEFWRDRKMSNDNVFDL